MELEVPGWTVFLEERDADAAEEAGVASADIAEEKMKWGCWDVCRRRVFMASRSHGMPDGLSIGFSMKRSGDVISVKLM